MNVVVLGVHRELRSQEQILLDALEMVRAGRVRALALQYVAEPGAFSCFRVPPEEQAAMLVVLDVARADMVAASKGELEFDVAGHG
jgi:hypothetical protein